MKPIYGHGVFFVSLDGVFIQNIFFEYVDVRKEFYETIRVDSLREEEVSNIKERMQAFLDEEIVKINGKVVKPKVMAVDVGFRTSPKRPYINFIIVFKGDFIKGLNVYENIYEPEVSEYDYTVLWIFHSGIQVVDADFGMPYERLGNNVMLLKVKKGVKTSGYERISFFV
ncbi:MAG: hypothetical protein B7O98_04720 [Zestosphaera tikiterensis]|uniref:Uncharacterized protein n=1 Tax=Zestosphaera tikiterensis TaxID=1973259 RepID=A0A2R7Y5U5_9CREN|nr:MAG: hypothetical protein B7O98_04720 [Zestosphaera tikiterensis]